jgi:hypothetical protein
MKVYGGVNVKIHIFLTSAIFGGVVSFTPGTHWIGGWAYPRASPNDVQKILDRIGSQNSEPSVAQPAASRYTD